MGDAVTTQTVFDGTKKALLKFTNISDGTGESVVKKIDVSELVDAPSLVKITQIWYTISGMAVHMLWDATANVLAHALAGDQSGHIDFREFGGIHNNAGDGVTGDLLFTTIGHTANDVYSIILEVEKT